MVEPHFSIVIPTHNRAEILRRSLGHLLCLPGIELCEILVVDDGSTDNTSVVVEDYRRLYPALLRPITLSNGGPARARNHGVRAASLPRILFIDDDVFPRDGMLRQHWDTLERGHGGSQGVLAWHPDIKRTALIQYIDSRGSQFAFDQIDDPDNLAFQYVYTGNFATHRDSILELGGFDESFYRRDLSFSAFEDTILGYELVRRGHKLAFTASAIADHLHDMTVNGFLKREYKVGFITRRLVEVYPDIARQLGVSRSRPFLHLQSSLFRFLAKSTTAAECPGFTFRMRLKHRDSFLRGLCDAQREG